MVKAANDSSYSSSCSPDVQRGVASSNHRWKAAFSDSPSAVVGSVVDAEHLHVVELVPAGVDLTARRPARAREDPGCGLARAVASAPTMRRAGMMPRAASAAPSTRRLLVAGGGEVVVVGRAERRLSVPHQEDAAHGRSVDEAVEPAADDLHGRTEERVHLVGRLPVEVPGVDLLGDHGHPEQPEDLVEPPPLGRHRPASALGVRRHELVAGQHAGQVRRHPPHHLELLGVVGLHPVGHRAGEVHERVAEGRHLPVEHPDDAVTSSARGRGCRA